MIEVLVVVSIISLLIAILVPSLSRARRQARATVCATRLRTLGQGLVLYANENADRLVPGRMPKVDDANWQIRISGGLKYRPTFVAMMGNQVGVPPFADPQPTATAVDREGQAGGRQDYHDQVYVCPTVADWTDERNGAFGYNYQFLGNSRLIDSSDPFSFKNWPVNLSRVRSPAACVAVGDCMGTAASYASGARGEYDNNAKDKHRFGNEGFNLDPPTVDPDNGEMAGFTSSPQVRSAADPRHLGRANILWVDGHASPHSLTTLGYSLSSDGVVELQGVNRLWNIAQKDEPWVQDE